MLLLQLWFYLNFFFCCCRAALKKKIAAVKIAYEISTLCIKSLLYMHINAKILSHRINLTLWHRLKIIFYSNIFFNGHSMCVFLSFCFVCVFFSSFFIATGRKLAIATEQYVQRYKHTCENHPQKNNLR